MSSGQAAIDRSAHYPPNANAGSSVLTARWTAMREQMGETETERRLARSPGLLAREVGPCEERGGDVDPRSSDYEPDARRRTGRLQIDRLDDQTDDLGPSHRRSNGKASNSCGRPPNPTSAVWSPKPLVGDRRCRWWAGSCTASDIGGLLQLVMAGALPVAAGRSRRAIGLLAGPARRRFSSTGCPRVSSALRIADELVVTLDTVKRHVSHIFDKLGTANRTEAVARTRELRLIP
jgi:Bacterial regulatory proteins, luxR family